MADTKSVHRLVIPRVGTPGTSALRNPGTMEAALVPEGQQNERKSRARRLLCIVRRPRLSV